MSSVYEKNLDKLIADIENKDVRTMMMVSSKNKMYPKDCLTNGALEILIKYIIKLECQVNSKEKSDVGK